MRWRRFPLRWRRMPQTQTRRERKPRQSEYIGDIPMLVAVPVETKDMNAAVCPSFGRAPYFLLFNTESRQSEIVDNPGASAQGGAGIKAAQALVDSKADALLTPRCGQNAADVLQAANIALHKSNDGSAAVNITLFTEGKLPVLEEIHAGFHGHGA
ncbi:Dinitrogenase iron-molybdenum cofactor family protein (modular protein) [uncultured delta proteobacterium]|uniref:Dinitrogenase iron-molybdenum cofactor family protein (Modular protein) n=1 Tax=uncultured delta proteobacterium TaxID=34034 RepID=A0A212KG06_9DELT|nr:Dinitrogenase iron-molybdenum cofactor family protein (modular protein) [uncultured delta proteobacterium]